jgi:hypothetical protein
MRALGSLALLLLLLCCPNAQAANLLFFGVGSSGGTNAPYLTATGPSSGNINVASTSFNVTLHNGTFNGTTNQVTLSDGGAGGTFVPASPVTPAAGSSFSFTYKPAVASPPLITISVGDNFGALLPGPLSYASLNTYTFTGPSSGAAGVPSTNFTVALGFGTFNGSQSITLSDGGNAGTWVPSAGSCTAGVGSCTLTPPSGSSFTLTYTPSIIGALTLTPSNANGWSNPPALTYNSQTAFTVTGPSGGIVNTASSNFTVTLGLGSFSGSQTITITGPASSTITPSAPFSGTQPVVTVTPTAGATSFTFTITPTTLGTLSISYTNAQGWVNPGPSSYMSVPASGPSAFLLFFP